MTTNKVDNQAASKTDSRPARGGMSVRAARALVYVTSLVFVAMAAVPTRAAELVYPTADGTLADGGVFGSFDGVVDNCNWEFERIGVSGAVTLSTETPASSVEHRMVFEYDLRAVNLTPPVEATLSFTRRGASVFPFPDVTLEVYSYPADLAESPDDFSAQPAIFQGAFVVPAGQSPTIEVLDVSAVVTAALSGAKRVAFRFQIDSGTLHPSNQVFIDALDSEPDTKPFLTIGSALAGDVDGDGDVDLDDYAVFSECMAGPDASPAPSSPAVSATDCVWAFDSDADADVDLHDLTEFLGFLAGD